MSEQVSLLTQYQVTPTQLINALTHLAPDVSALVVGEHGIGKTAIVNQLAENLRKMHSEHDWPCFDRRLAQMTEGDIIGVPHVKLMDERGVTAFLPVDWFDQACREPCVLLLDELNRAEIQIMNSAFQIIGSRELSGRKLHPMTRVIACVNPPAHYQVQEMDKALLDRFLIMHLRHDHRSWLTWARGRLDDALVDFIEENPSWLHHNIADTHDLEAAPTPRSWEKLDIQLAHAGIPAWECQGRAAPDLLPIYSHGLIGQGAATAFLKWLRDRDVFLKVEDVLDDWHTDRVQKKFKKLRHEEILSCISRIGEDSKTRTWSKKQGDNMEAFGTVLSGEDKVLLFTAIAQGGNDKNIQRTHSSSLISAVVESCKRAKEVGDKRGS